MLDIKSILPHREPFLFIDTVKNINTTSITACRKVNGNDFYFKGHYPHNPVTPGVILLETIFQAGALLIAHSCKGDIKGTPVVTRVNNVKFKKIVKPDDDLIIEVQLEEKIAAAYCFNGKIRLNNKIVVSCEYMATLVNEGT